MQKIIKHELSRFIFLFIFLLSLAPSLRAASEKGVLVFGGSFSPPTIEHMGIMARLMERNGFHRAVMLPTYPYKKGAAPAETSLRLSTTAVEHFDEVLEINSIAHRDFKQIAPGKVSWKGKDGNTYQLEVSDFEIKNKIAGDTLQTLRSLPNHLKIPPEQIYWASGADSFESIQSWTPKWKELLRRVNWLVISRPGANIDPKKDNPLSTVLEHDGLIKRYKHERDTDSKVYRYKSTFPNPREILVVDGPTLNISSSLARESLTEDPTHEKAEQILQPSVFKECLQNGDFGGPERVAFTQTNLEHYLLWLLKKLDRKIDTPEDRQAFRELSLKLVEMMGEVAASEKQKPRVIAALSHIGENLVEFIDVRNMWPKAKALLPELIKKYGVGFATTFIALELVERFVFPGILYSVGGRNAVLLSPLLHQEYFSIPAFYGYQKLSKARKNWKLASPEQAFGDKTLYNELTQFRRKLLRGDPDSILTHASLQTPMGIGSDQILINIVKSRLPKWIPLKIRQWDNAQISWYDLNLSTNELESTLRYPELARQLYDSANSNNELYAQLLLAAIEKDPAAKLRLEIFLGHRHFKRLSFGDVPQELLNGFSEAERAFILKAKALKEMLQGNLPGKNSPKQLEDLVSDYYVLNRMIQADPKRLTDPSFWKEYSDLLVRRYPGKELRRFPVNDFKRLRSQLGLLADLMMETHPEVFGGLKISYGKNFQFTVNANQSRVESRNLNERAVLNAATEYVRHNTDIYNRAPANSIAQLWTPIGKPSLIDPKDQGNFEWELRLALAERNAEFEVLERGTKQAEEFLGVQPHDKKAPKAFQQARNELLRERNRLQDEFLKLEYDWLRLKIEYPGTGPELDVPGYENIRKRFLNLDGEMGAINQTIRSHNHMMMGIEPVDLQDLNQLTTKLGVSIGLSPNENYLGKNIFESGVASVKALAKRCGLSRSATP